MRSSGSNTSKAIISLCWLSFLTKSVTKSSIETIHWSISLGHEEEVVRYFEVTEPVEDVRIFHKNTSGKLDFEVYDADNEQVDYSTKNFTSTISKLDDWYITNYYDLPKGSYKIIFEEDAFIAETNSSVILIGDAKNRVGYTTGLNLNRKYELNPYLLEKGETKAIKGTLFPFDDTF